ncbi:hypothetical protein BTA30_03015 [Bacillus swezeyi]|uniref:Uncharacterized protein n=1 Tax=Bacillus swezeyi TaxID=1925020 RepID=A0A1R1S0Y0_9BACI|nr:hypothetical protein BW143_02635 [Bacillus swezeyi]OMI31910.1 hypothetical protein BTA30_03015 [Bacillus swezeyi]
MFDAFITLSFYIVWWPESVGEFPVFSRFQTSHFERIKKAGHSQKRTTRCLIALPHRYAAGFQLRHHADSKGCAN